MAEPFISRDDLSALLGQDVSGEDKALIAIDAACDTVRVIAEQTFNLVTDDEIRMDGTGTDALLLPQLPVTEISEVIENGTTLTADTDYMVSADGVLLRLPSIVENGSISLCRRQWWPGRQNIAITYSHGYAEIPRDVRIVALSLAARLYGQGAGVVFQVLGQYQVRYSGAPGDLTSTETLILHKYRR